MRGVKAMVEDERYCVDILNQVSAVQAALNSFSKVLLSNHIKTCVVDDIEVLTFSWIYIILRHVIEAWLSLVERCVRDAEVACSNHVASILL